MQRPRNLVLPADLTRYEDDLEADLIGDTDTSSSDSPSPRKPSSPSKTVGNSRFMSTTKRRTVFWSILLVGLATGVVLEAYMPNFGACHVG
ncbi:hypothetical protein PF007_g6653 [Phytophthora fragariae]|uniref:Uncharacterized protein n=1 Tax=Phytophthora fragariae TaxID=53985 RepID=A0A6A3T5Z5_9STRA|nr:hypothetical protein PF007_g6653 [Phytophthora fragariae]